VSRGLMGRLVEEPLLHFMIIGAAIFLAFGVRDAGVRPTETTAVIELTPEAHGRLLEQFKAIRNREPTAEEQAAMIDGWLREEVLYREALALGLDRDDTVIRQRLRLKMEFLVEGMADTMTPDDATLQAWFADRAQDFAVPSALSFVQVGIGAEDDVEDLIRQLEAGADPSAIGRGSLLPPMMETAVPSVIDGSFGPGFSEILITLPENQWVGPVPSAFGQHVVRILARQTGKVPTFDEVRQQVIEKWRIEQTQVLRDAQFQALLGRYSVVLPEGAQP
jgi:PPIC-type PPIASE domain